MQIFLYFLCHFVTFLDFQVRFCDILIDFHAIQLSFSFASRSHPVRHR